MAIEPSYKMNKSFQMNTQMNRLTDAWIKGIDVKMIMCKESWMQGHINECMVHGCMDAWMKETLVA